MKPGNGPGFAPGRTRARKRDDERGRVDASLDMPYLEARLPLDLEYTDRVHKRGASVEIRKAKSMNGRAAIGSFVPMPLRHILRCSCDERAVPQRERALPHFSFGRQAER